MFRDDLLSDTAGFTVKVLRITQFPVIVSPSKNSQFCGRHSPEVTDLLQYEFQSWLLVLTRQRSSPSGGDYTSVKWWFCCGIFWVFVWINVLFSPTQLNSDLHTAHCCFSPLSFLFRTSCAAYFVLNCSVICSVLVQMKSAVRVGRPGGI